MRYVGTILQVKVFTAQGQSVQLADGTAVVGDFHRVEAPPGEAVPLVEPFDAVGLIDDQPHGGGCQREALACGAIQFWQKHTLAFGVQFYRYGFVWLDGFALIGVVGHALRCGRQHTAEPQQDRDDISFHGVTVLV